MKNAEAREPRGHKGQRTGSVTKGAETLGVYQQKDGA